MAQDTQGKVTDHRGSSQRSWRELRATTMAVSILLLFSLFALGVKLLRPSSVQIVVEGEETRIEQIPNLFSSGDAVWLIVSSMIAAGSAVFLFSQQPIRGGTRQEAHYRRWEEIHKRLKGNDKSIYGVILASEGVLLQSEIVKKTGLGKGTVSIILGRMEARDLLEKKKNGMVNVVLLR